MLERVDVDSEIAPPGSPYSLVIKPKRHVRREYSDYSMYRYGMVCGTTAGEAKLVLYQPRTTI